MLPAARHQSIVDAVQRERVVRVSDLAQQLGVSLMTVRRDIEMLEESGQAGADPRRRQAARRRQHARARVRAEVHPADRAEAGHCRGGRHPGARGHGSGPQRRHHHLGAGQGTGQRAAHHRGDQLSADRRPLPPRRSASGRAATLHGDPHRRRAHAVGRPGGTHRDGGAAGSCTWICCSSACTAWTPRPATPRPNLLEAETDRAFVAASRKVVVLADHTKWGTQGISTIAKLEEADEVISDAGLSREAQRILRDRVGRLRPGVAGTGLLAGQPQDCLTSRLRGEDAVPWLVRRGRRRPARALRLPPCRAPAAPRWSAEATSTRPPRNRRRRPAPCRRALTARLHGGPGECRSPACRSWQRWRWAGWPTPGGACLPRSPRPG